MGLVGPVHLLLLVTGLRLAACIGDSYQNPVTEDELISPITQSIDKSFYRFSTELQSDKTGRGSSYHYIYSKYLSPVRREQMRLLEIGLGCDMHHGVNGLNTLALWRRFLTNTRVSFVENDAKCAQKYKSEIEKVARGKLYIGDQEDTAVLNQIVEDAKAFSGYDIIVDDGSHKAGKMLASLRVLWQSLKTGGIYVVEDISENYIEKHYLDKSTFTQFMKNAIDIVQCRMKPMYMGPDSPVRREFIDFCASNPMDIISMECMPEACVLVKGKPRTRGIPEGPATSAAAAEQVADEATAAELGSLGGKAAGFSTEEAAAEMFRAKPSQAGAKKAAAEEAAAAAREAAAAAREDPAAIAAFLASVAAQEAVVAATGTKTKKAPKQAKPSKGGLVPKLKPVKGSTFTGAALPKPKQVNMTGVGGRERFADVNQELVREMATKTVQLNTLEAALAARKKDADERAAAREAAITEAIRRGEEVDPEGGGGADEEDTVVLQPLPGAGAKKTAGEDLMTMDDADTELEALAAEAAEVVAKQAPKQAAKKGASKSKGKGAVGLSAAKKAAVAKAAAVAAAMADDAEGDLADEAVAGADEEPDVVEEGAAGEEDALDSADVADDVAEMVSDEEGEAQQVSAQDDRSELLRGQKVLEEPAAEEAPFEDDFGAEGEDEGEEEEGGDEEALRHRKLLLRHLQE